MNSLLVYLDEYLGWIEIVSMFTSKDFNPRGLGLVVSYLNSYGINSLLANLDEYLGWIKILSMFTSKDFNPRGLGLVVSYLNSYGINSLLANLDEYLGWIKILSKFTSKDFSASWRMPLASPRGFEIRFKPFFYPQISINRLFNTKPIFEPLNSLILSINQINLHNEHVR